MRTSGRHRRPVRSVVLPRATRETIVLLEAAGFDVILVETVGVGQSEVTVANMVDCFTFLTLARTGDQLQGIKKGVLELADLVAVNKADGKHEREAKGAARELAGALRLIYPHDAIWKPPVITMSGLEGVGLDEFWGTVTKHREVLTEAGQFEEEASQATGRLDLDDGQRSAATQALEQRSGACDPGRRPSRACVTVR